MQGQEIAAMKSESGGGSDGWMGGWGGGRRVRVSDGTEMWRGDTIEKTCKKTYKLKEGKMWKSRDKRDVSTGLKLSLGCINLRIKIHLGFILQYYLQSVCK